MQLSDVKSVIIGVWEQVNLRYTTGSGGSLTTHIARLDFMVEAESDSTGCDFDASVIIAPGVKGP